MSKRRKTRDDQKALLLQRVQDIYSGATGYDWSQYGEDENFATASDLAKIIPTLRLVFGEPRKDWFIYRTHNIDRFEQAIAAADFLWDHGVRANKRLEPEEETNG